MRMSDKKYIDLPEPPLTREDLHARLADQTKRLGHIYPHLRDQDAYAIIDRLCSAPPKDKEVAA
jgi:hypothetical protein